MIMKEISLHVLDIVENSISAGATLVEIEVLVDNVRDSMRVSVNDNGCGMDEEMCERVISPFTTSRTTRKVGLGIPFFKEGAEGCDGSFTLKSKPGVGTYIAAEYRVSHIDRAPLGDMAETMHTLVACNESTDFTYTYNVDGREFVFDTRVIKKTLGAGIPLSVPEVSAWIKDYLYQGIEEINGGI